MTDLVQWLDIFVVFICSNYKYVHVTVELNLGMQIEISYVCITFRKKIKSNWFLLGSCPSYFESGSSSWNNMCVYTFYYIMYNLTCRTIISPWDCWQAVVDSVWTILSDSPSVAKSLPGDFFCAQSPSCGYPWVLISSALELRFCSAQLGSIFREDGRWSRFLCVCLLSFRWSCVAILFPWHSQGLSYAHMEPRGTFQCLLKLAPTGVTFHGNGTWLASCIFLFF